MADQTFVCALGGFKSITSSLALEFLCFSILLAMAYGSEMFLLALLWITYMHILAARTDPSICFWFGRSFKGLNFQRICSFEGI
jgi:hypothetical protein